ncbi:hypothetical protein CAOG_00490 [Capsaspora owczarzaki ATCC 30864]|nr:hypothetical protein CAOG_00490 [Capsaspora owczarzaki ATCC 30864]|eukprot:XP_004365361.1 hypothetical protein CAOG_00490 [Capsaspora owczarzaki ATCC 30864]
MSESPESDDLVMVDDASPSSSSPTAPAVSPAAAPGVDQKKKSAAAPGVFAPAVESELQQAIAAEFPHLDEGAAAGAEPNNASTSTSTDATASSLHSNPNSQASASPAVAALRATTASPLVAPVPIAFTSAVATDKQAASLVSSLSLSSSSSSSSSGGTQALVAPHAKLAFTYSASGSPSHSAATSTTTSPTSSRPSSPGPTTGSPSPAAKSTSFRAKAERQLILTKQKVREVFTSESHGVVTEDKRVNDRTALFEYVQSMFVDFADYHEHLQRALTNVAAAQEDLSLYLQSKTEKFDPTVGSDLAKAGHALHTANASFSSSVAPAALRINERHRTFRDNVVPGVHTALKQLTAERVTYDAYRLHCRELEEQMRVEDPDAAEVIEVAVSRSSSHPDGTASPSRHAAPNKLRAQQQALQRHQLQAKYVEAMQQVTHSSKNYEHLRNATLAKTDSMDRERQDVMHLAISDMLDALNNGFATALESLRADYPEAVAAALPQQSGAPTPVAQ